MAGTGTGKVLRTMTAAFALVMFSSSMGIATCAETISADARFATLAAN
jgi:hypothetical protein